MTDTDANEATAPRSAAAQELRELSLIMRHVEKLSHGGKWWLRDRLNADLVVEAEIVEDDS